MKATPRRFYRWKSFWLGLCVLVFLGCAWSDSTRHAKGMGWCRGNFGVYARAWSETFSIGKDRTGGRIQGFDFWNLPNRDRLSESAFPKVVRDPGVDSVEFQLPFWLLIVLFLIPWSAWLFWHWKRTVRS